MNESVIYRAEITHIRTGPVRHRLRNSVFYLYLDLDKLDEFSSQSRIFSHNRFNLLSFYDSDHGGQDGKPVRAWIKDSLESADLYDPEGHIYLLALPRIFGYAFNPLSVFYCFNRSDELVAVLYEVRNTFGEKHGYLLPARPSSTGIVRQETAKRFHVSPFIGMAARYRFRLNVPAETLTIGIHETAADGVELTAVLRGHRRSLTDRELLRAVLAMPLMTLKVIASIHIHAVQLWLKSARFHRKPPPPLESVTVGSLSFPEVEAPPNDSDR